MAMIDYQVAIPTYKRAEILVSQSLATLDRGKVDRDKVTVFVANEEQGEEYAPHLKGNWRMEISCPGKFLSLRHYVGKHYKKGTPLLSLDDDINWFTEKQWNDTLQEYSGTIDDIVDLGFRTCNKFGAAMWGMNPTANALWMKREISVGLRYIIGCFHGLYAGEEAIIGRRLALNAPSCDDHETSLRAYMRSGAVVRFEYLCPRTKYFAEGGIDAYCKDQGTARRTIHDARMFQIAKAWPDLCYIKRKAGNVPNLRFKSKTHARLIR